MQGRDIPDFARARAGLDAGKACLDIAVHGPAGEARFAVPNMGGPADGGRTALRPRPPAGRHGGDRSVAPAMEMKELHATRRRFIGARATLKARLRAASLARIAAMPCTRIRLLSRPIDVLGN